MAEFNVHGIAFLIVLLVASGIAITYFVNKSKRESPIGRILARLFVFVSAKKASNFEYKITFHFGCPSYNFYSKRTHVTFGFLDSHGTSTEGRIDHLSISDTAISPSCIIMKRATRLTKEKFDKVWLNLGTTSRLFLYNITTEEVSAQERFLTNYPIMRWVTSIKKSFDLDPQSSREFQRTHVSLPRMYLYEYLFFLIFAASMVTVMTCYLPVLEKKTIVDCALSVAVGIVTGLLILSVTIFFYHILIVKRQAVHAFNRRTMSQSEKNNPNALKKRFNRYKMRCFLLMLLTSLVGLIAVTVQTFQLNDWSVNAWTVCAIIANAIVILTWVIVTYYNMYTYTARKFAKYFFKPIGKAIVVKRVTSLPGALMDVGSTIKDDTLHDHEEPEMVPKPRPKKKPAPKPPSSPPPPPPLSSTPVSHTAPPTMSEPTTSPTPPGSSNETGKTVSSHPSSGSETSHDKGKEKRERRKSTSSSKAVPKSQVHSERKKKSKSFDSHHGSKSKSTTGKGHEKKNPLSFLGLTFPVSDVPSTNIPDSPILSLPSASAK